MQRIALFAVPLPTIALAYPRPASVPATNALANAGLLDATLYKGVDATGKSDSTKGLQAALDDGYKYGLTVYLPSGTYVVSDSLHEDQIFETSGCAAKVGNYGGVTSQIAAPGLVGAVRPTRPQIVLADNSAGFNDTSSLKAVVAFRNYDTADTKYGTTWTGEADCGMRMVMRGFDVVLGKGNSGAIGLQNPSAQYSTIEDVSIDATGGYAGLRGSVTTESMVNISVTGGQYGLIADICCGISVAGLTLKGQTVASLWSNTFGTTTVSGFSFSPAPGASAVLSTGDVSQSNLITLIDGTITTTDTTPVINNALERGLYLANVFVNAKGPLVLNGKNNVAIDAGWQHVSEYSYTDPVAYPLGSGKNVNSVTLLDGKLDSAQLMSTSAVASPPSDLLTRHAWTSIAWLDDPGVKNVLDADIGAKGDGVTDDSDAIQKALDNYTEVFLPRGDYLLGKPITMHKDNMLFGVPGSLTRIYPKWTTTTLQHGIETDADADGTAYLADVHFLLQPGAAMSYLGAVHWRVGRSSIVRHVHVEEYFENSGTDTGTQARKVIEIEGGGGRWYGLDVDASWRSGNPDYRQVLVTNTKEPLSFYGLNLEHSGEWQIEIASSSNVRILGTKTESKEFALFNGSSNVMLAGLTGNTGGINDLVQFMNATDVLSPNLSIFAEEHVDDTGPIVTENGTNTDGTTQYDNCAVLRRGTFDATAWDSVGGTTTIATTTSDAGTTVITPPNSTDGGIVATSNTSDSGRTPVHHAGGCSMSDTRTSATSLLLVAIALYFARRRTATR